MITTATITTITIQRPDGTIEDAQRAGSIDAATRQAMTDATRAAGRGEIIGWSEDARNYQTTRVTCPTYTPSQGCPRHGETCR